MSHVNVMLELATVVVTVTDEAVQSRFADGSVAVTDITKSHGPNYARVALFWGYDDHLRYAQHHDLVHCWLWDRLQGAPSPTLWAVAHDLPPPPENRLEEHLVNHVQFTLAQRTDDYSSLLRRHIGKDWRAVLVDLVQTLDGLGLPLP